jgi:hypothetical protein
MHSLVEQIEQLFLPDLERLASQMRGQFPALEFNVWHSPTGTLTEYQGYDLGLECVFPAGGHNEPTTVALSIELCHLTSTPRLMAGVEWSGSSGHSEADFRDWSKIADWPEATSETIEELRKTLPTLVQAFGGQSAYQKPDGVFANYPVKSSSIPSSASPQQLALLRLGCFSS